MKIDLGSNGKIIGTRRVSPNGQVSGLRDLAGKEVLVVLSDEATKGQQGSEDYFRDLEEFIAEQVRLAIDNALTLQKTYFPPVTGTEEPGGKAKEPPKAPRK